MKITKVEIKLWGRFDIDWELFPDVNILSGINGSGKSTILEGVAGLITTGTLTGELRRTIPFLKVHFDNGDYLLFDRSADHDEPKEKLEKLHEMIRIDVVKTFDNILMKVGKRNDSRVITELDGDIFKLQKQYLDYQLNIGKKAFEIVSRKNGKESIEKVALIREKLEKFLEIIDLLFFETGKRINRDDNEISFLHDNEKILTWQLSSGEKQMLVILMTVLVQDNKPAIMFMDEPEISLHFDWQKKLIQYVQEINPNVQIILATHSPAVVIEGWHDKVFNVKDMVSQ